MARPTITFKNVGGLEELKEQIKMNIIYPFQNPALFKSFGKKIGGGILLYGPPGFRIAVMQNPDNPDYRKNFLIALKAKHKYYSLFWHYSLVVKSAGCMGFLIRYFTFYLLFGLCGACLELVGWAVTQQNPFLIIVGVILSVLSSLLFLYFLFANPIFNFLARRGLIK